VGLILGQRYDDTINSSPAANGKVFRQSRRKALQLHRMCIVMAICWTLLYEQLFLLRQVTIVEVRYATFRSGVWVWAFRLSRFGHGTFRSGRCSLVTFRSRHFFTRTIIIFVYLNDCIGRRTVTLAGVMPTPFDVAAKG